MNERKMNSPAGTLYLAADTSGLCAVRLLRAGEDVPGHSDMPVLVEAERQLLAYFAGELRRFDLPLSAQGTPFELAVWHRLEEIAYGDLESYGSIASQLGRPGAARAVGGACARNPLLIVVPCHRVVAASGRLTGFAAGLEVKRRLLALEGWTIEEDRVCR